MIVASLAILAVASVPASSEQSSTCRQYGLGTLELDSIKVLLPVDTRLPEQRPTAICFELPIRELGPLLEALARGPVAVSAFDRDGRQLGDGTLVIIENATDRGNVRLRAIFPH